MILNAHYLISRSQKIFECLLKHCVGTKALCGLERLLRTWDHGEVTWSCRCRHHVLHEAASTDIVLLCWTMIPFCVSIGALRTH